MIYALAAFAFVCLALALWLMRDWLKMLDMVEALDREAQEWAKLYWDLRDDTPARGSDGRFTRRGK